MHMPWEAMPEGAGPFIVEQGVGFYGHVKPISVELEHGNCRNTTPETIVRLCTEMQRKRGLWLCLFRGQKRLICNDPEKPWAAFHFFPSRQSPAIPVHMGTAIAVLKILKTICTTW